MIYFLVLVLLWVSLMVYFRIAVHYRIIDRPNDRSSHSSFTIRGAGVIFLMAMMLAGWLHFDNYKLPILATLLIGGISFIDDRVSLSYRLRILVQVLSTGFLLYGLKFHTFFPLWAIPLLYILVLGIINAYNFMDGINGMTGLYSLLVLGALQYINFHILHFIEADMIWFPMLACLVFLFFNFRKKAKCFAGDVGSISMAFWVVFLLLVLIRSGGSWLYFLFLTVYGADAGMTVLHRLLRKKNIFEPHRTYLFQLLANEAAWPHLLVSTIYTGIQAVMIILILWLQPFVPSAVIATIILLPPFLAYLLLKPHLMRLVKEHEKA